MNLVIILIVALLISVIGNVYQIVLLKRTKQFVINTLDDTLESIRKKQIPIPDVPIIPLKEKE